MNAQDTDELGRMVEELNGDGDVAVGFIEAKMLHDAKGSVKPFSTPPMGYDTEHKLYKRIILRIDHLDQRNENDKYALLAALHDRLNAMIVEPRFGFQAPASVPA